MAEFCLDCFNKRNDTNYTKKDFIISKDLGLCEGCGELKQVVIAKRGIHYYLWRIRYLILPFWIILRLLYLPIYLIKLYFAKVKK